MKSNDHSTIKNYINTDFKHKSDALNCYKLAHVIIPTDAPPTTGWPVCYLLHAFGGNRFSWVNAIKLKLSLYAKHWVFIFPESGRYWFINDDAGRKYENYLVGNLIPLIENNFPVSRLAEHRIIGGFSMGGAASLFISLKYPGLFKTTFSFAGAFSAARREGDPYIQFRNDNCLMPSEKEHCRVWGTINSLTRKTYDPENIVKYARVYSDQYISLEIGKDDYPRMLDMNRHMHELLLIKNIKHDYLECNGNHSWNYAEKALYKTYLKLKKLKPFLFHREFAGIVE
jgi:S-formylglutathione hydrolase FrmB